MSNEKPAMTVEERLASLEAIEQRLARLEAEAVTPRAQRGAGRGPSRGRIGVALGICALLTASTGVALSQVPGTSLACQAGLFCLGAGQPARASEVNHNFAQLARWLTEKTGSLTTAGIQTGALTTTGPNELGGDVVVDGELNANGNLVVQGALDTTGELTALSVRTGALTTTGPSALGGDLVVSGAIDTTSGLVFRPPGNQLAHRTMRLSAVRSEGGTSCQASCGTGLCLGGWVDTSARIKVECSASSPNRYCVCVGPQP